MPTASPVRRARLLDALRQAVLERLARGTGEAVDTASQARLLRRRRDCASLVRLGEPAAEARALALRLDAALGLGVGADAVAQTRLACDLTALLVEIYDGLLAREPPLTRG